MRTAARRVLLGLVTLVIAASVAFSGSPAWAASTVRVNCDAGGDLQKKLDTAPSGTTILIRGTCHGHFVITGKAFTLEGNPHATLDGDDSGQTVHQNTAGKALHLVRLTVTGGAGVDAGAGIFAFGPLSLDKVTVTGNEATSTSTSTGGGILSNGPLTITSSTISSNRATAVGAGATANGGGIAADGVVTISDSVVSGNHATASSPSGVAHAQGGGIYGGTLTLDHTKLIGNRAAASGDGGQAVGSAIWIGSSAGDSKLTGAVIARNLAASKSGSANNPYAADTVHMDSSSTLTISGSKISGNVGWAMGLAAQAQVTAVAVGSGGPLLVKKSSIQNNRALAFGPSTYLTNVVLEPGFVSGMTISRSSIVSNSGRAISSAGTASASGLVGTAFLTSVVISNSTVDRNALTAIASSGDSDAESVVGPFSITMKASTVSRNAVTAIAKTMGHSATARAGGESAAFATIKNSTIALNHVKATAPASGGTATAQGGGLFLNNSGTLVDDTVAGNTASATGATHTATGGGLYVSSTSPTLQDTIVAGNHATTGPDCAGGPTSKGHNLIGKTAGCSYTKATGDKVNTDPKLGPLANHGGPTQSMGIAATSPAHNAVPLSACPLHTDQRGVHRPQGAKCDIGAFELKPGEVATSAAPTSGIAGPVRASSSGPFVNCDRGGDLQQHLDSAPSGTAVLIKGTCHGNFVISGRSLTLKGYPSATLDGMDTGSTLQVTTNDTLHLKHLTVTAGMAQSGAGVYSKGSVTLRKTKVMGNEAASSSGAVGGGIYTVANLTLFSSSISSNKATAVGSGVAEAGGVFTGNLTTTGSVVSGNRTTAALGSGTPAVLDTIYAGGKVSITGSRLTGNRVGASGDGPTVGAAALGVEGPGPVSLEGDVVSGNMAAAVSDTSSDANAGRTIGAPTAPVTVSESKISGNLLSADGGANAPGNAQAGGVYADKLTLKRSIVQRNIAIARGTDASVSGSAIWGNAVHLIRSTVARNSGQATSSSGPASSDGTIYGNTVSMSRSTVDRNTLVARSSGANASAQGGGLDTSVMAITAATISRNIVTAHAHTEADGSAGGILESSGTIKNSTVALNSVRATSPKSGGNTFALGGGFFIPSPGHLVDDTVARNTVSGSGGTVTADGGGIAVGGLVTLEGTIVATNKAPKGPDCSGIPTSKGHNLIGKAAGCPFTKKTGDRANVKPLLGTLAYNGGPTQTIGIKTTSPAHNAVPTSACPLHSDQRGVRRPQGPRCDIGAFELKPGETVPSA